MDLKKERIHIQGGGVHKVTFVQVIFRYTVG